MWITNSFLHDHLYMMWKFEANLSDYDWVLRCKQNLLSYISLKQQERSSEHMLCLLKLVNTLRMKNRCRQTGVQSHSEVVTV